MKVVILLGSPTDMYLDISRSKWIGEPNYFLSALLQHFSAALFSLYILLSFYSWTLFYFLWSSALLPTSRFLSSAPIFRSCSVSLDFVLHCSSSCGSQGSAAVQMHRIAIMVIVIIITILIIVLIIVIVIITSLSWWCSSKFLHNSWMYSLFTFSNLLCHCEKTLFFMTHPSAYSYICVSVFPKEALNIGER